MTYSAGHRAQLETVLPGRVAGGKTGNASEPSLRDTLLACGLVRHRGRTGARLRSPYEPHQARLRLARISFGADLIQRPVAPVGHLIDDLAGDPADGLREHPRSSPMARGRSMTRAGVRARSYHASPGKIRSLGSNAQGAWMNCASTPRMMRDAKGPEGQMASRSHPQLPAQTLLTEVRRGEQGQKRRDPHRGQFVIPT